MKIYKSTFIEIISYFGVKDMTTKKEAACQSINNNLKLIPSGEHVSANFRPFKAKNKNLKSLIFPQGLPREKFFNFQKNSFRRACFNILPTIWGQKTKIWNFPKISVPEKSPKGEFLFFIFLQKFFRESTFQQISDHFRQKTKKQKSKVWNFSENF